MSCAGLRLADGVHNHTPLEITTFSINYENLLVPGEALTTIDASAVIAEDTPGLVIDSLQVVSPNVSVVVSAGVANNDYFVVVKVNTNLGQKLEGAVQVVVGDAVEV